MNDPVRIPYSSPCFFGGGGNGGVISLDFPPPKKNLLKLNNGAQHWEIYIQKKKHPLEILVDLSELVAVNVVYLPSKKNTSGLAP